MPTLSQTFTLDISPEKYIRNCSREELIELDLLLGSPAIQAKINQTEYYCRLHVNGAIDNKCQMQCKDCASKTPDELLKQNFLIDKD